MEATKREHDRQLKEKDDVNEALKLKVGFGFAEPAAWTAQLDPGCVVQRVGCR